MFTGIDVSKHQGKIDWEKVKQYGIDFAIVRAGFGKNNKDEMAHYNALRCNELGIKLGFYWFSYALNEQMAVKEAEYLYEYVKAHKTEMPVYYDFEYDSVRYMKQNGIEANPALINRLTCAFCNKLEELGCYAGFYSNVDYWKRVYRDSTKSKYDLWLADWSGEDAYVPDVKLWQTSDKGIVPGIKGNVDMDMATIDFPELLHRKHLNNL